MADPVIVTIPEWTWVKVAAGIKSVKLNRKITTVYYYKTYRLLGETAPTTPTIGTVPEEALRIFDIKTEETIESSEPIDVYIMCQNQDDDADDTGKISVGPVQNDFDINIQDQTTAFDDFFFIQQIGSPTTLDGDITFDPDVPQYTIDVASVASISIGDTIFIFTGVTGEERFFDAVVLGISVLTLTLDRSIDFSFEDGDTIISTTKDLNVDGSVTPQIFEIRAGGPTAILEFDITRILIENLSASAVSLSTFGDIAGGITRGLQLRDKLSATVFKQKWNIKQNKDFGLLGFDWEPFAAANPIFGQDGFLWRFTLAGPDKHGVVKIIGYDI